MAGKVLFEANTNFKSILGEKIKKKNIVLLENKLFILSIYCNYSFEYLKCKIM